MKLKAIVLAASLSLFAASTFAADDLSSLVIDTSGPDLATFNASALAIAADTSGLAGNDAAIVQNGDSNIAIAEQTGGAGNFVAIAQDQAANGVSAQAMVYQIGNFNAAVVYQH